MKTVVCCIAIVTQLLAVSFASADTNYVISYDINDFLLSVTKKINFVLFCKPTSSACKEVAPIWNELAEHYHREDSLVTIAQVDCMIEQELCADQELKEFPKMRFFFKEVDSYLDFSEEQNFDDLHKFVEDQVHTAEEINVGHLPDAVVELADDSFEYFISHGLHLVKFYTPWCAHCTKLAPVWHQLATDVGGTSRLFISQLDCSRFIVTCQEHSITSFPSFVLFLNGIEVEKYHGKRNLEDLKAFLQTHLDEYMKLQLSQAEIEDGVTRLDDDTFHHAAQNGLVFVKFYTPGCEKCAEVLPIWAQLAKANEGRKITIAKVDCEVHKGICEELLLDTYPKLILFDNGIYAHDHKGNNTLQDFQEIVDLFLSHDEL